MMCDKYIISKAGKYMYISEMHMNKRNTMMFKN